MDPPLKLFGQTIALATSASFQDDALDGVGTTSSGPREELSSPPQDRTESGAESVAKSELPHAEVGTGCCTEISSSVSNGSDDDKMSSSFCERQEALKGRGSEGAEDLDVEEVGFRQEEEINGDDAGGKGGKMLRRPDKLVPCPRCHSLETKFCYYNNYNVNQPRHFCKHCQRYWTAGGTLRNVPVGAGRRKNKHGSVVSPRQTADMGLVRGDEPDVAAPLLAGKGVALPGPVQVPVVQTVLGASMPCSSKPILRVPVGGASSDGVHSVPYGMRVPSLEATYMLASAEALNPGEAGVAADNRPRMTALGFDDGGGGHNQAEGFCGLPPKDGSGCVPPSGSGGSNLLPAVKGEAASPSKHINESDFPQAWTSAGPGVRGSHGAPGSYGFFNGGWPYGYNVGWSVGAAFCGGAVPSVGNVGLPPPAANVAAWSGAAPGNLWPGMAWPVPGLSWTPSGWGPAPWPVAHWPMEAAPAGAPVPRSPPVAGGGAGGVPTPVSCPAQGAAPGSSLGKHARPLEGGTADGTVWAPKSLRMADPEAAMSSSVWRVLNVGCHPELVPASATFRAFQPKSDSRKAPDGDQQTAQATLHANPAAMCRSMYFQERN